MENTHTELMACARYGDLAELQQMIKINESLVCLFMQDVNGNTTLHMAAANGHLDIIDLLLEQNPSFEAINLQNARGNTPLHWAALNGHTDIATKLLKRGADAMLRNEAGHTALYEAQCAEKHEVVGLLLDNMKLEEDEEGEVEEGEESHESKVEDVDPER